MGPDPLPSSARRGLDQPMNPVMGNFLEADEERSTGAKIYMELRRQIISGELPPGSRLRERTLAEMLGVSRIPLREALPQLEADGFIQTELRKGAVVTQLTLRDIEELFDVRLGTEVHATRLAARRVGSGVSPRLLRAAMSRADAALMSRDLNWIAESNAELHEEIIQLAGNSLLSGMMRSVAGRDRWVFQLTTNRDPEIACKEHHELCDAIYAGNEEFAAAISYSHIERGRQATLDALNSVLPKERSDRLDDQHGIAEVGAG